MPTWHEALEWAKQPNGGRASFVARRGSKVGASGSRTAYLGCCRYVASVCVTSRQVADCRRRARSSGGRDQRLAPSRPSKSGQTRKKGSGKLAHECFACVRLYQEVDGVSPVHVTHFPHHTGHDPDEVRRLLGVCVSVALTSPRIGAVVGCLPQDDIDTLKLPRECKNRIVHWMVQGLDNAQIKKKLAATVTVHERQGMECVPVAVVHRRCRSTSPTVPVVMLGPPRRRWMGLGGVVAWPQLQGVRGCRALGCRHATTTAQSAAPNRCPGNWGVRRRPSRVHGGKSWSVCARGVRVSTLTPLLHGR